MKPRKTLIAANWKMHKSISEAVSFVESLQEEVNSLDDREVLIAPPFTALSSVRKVMTRKGYRLGAQNCQRKMLQRAALLGCIV